MLAIAVLHSQISIPLDADESEDSRSCRSESMRTEFSGLQSLEATRLHNSETRAVVLVLELILALNSLLTSELRPPL